MKINHHNYEEYFILYLDNELSAADREMVEAFIAQHPDLKGELDILGQFKLQPEPVLFPDKSALMKGQLSEEEMMLYMDAELSAPEAERVAGMIRTDEVLQKEFALIRKTKLEPEALVFPDKSILYRKEERARVFSINWRRIAAAAIIILMAAGTTVIVTRNRGNDTGNPEIVKTKETKPVTPVNKSPENNIAKQVTPQESTEEPVKVPAPVETRSNSIAASNRDDVSPRNKEVQQQMQQSPSNELPVPETNRAIAFENHIPTKTSDPEYQFGNSDVTSLSPQPSNIRTVAHVPTYDGIDEQEPAGGKKLRGFFRKVTRTLEKRTNIDATDEDGRLLVAGLAIKLK